MTDFHLKKRWGNVTFEDFQKCCDAFHETVEQNAGKYLTACVRAYSQNKQMSEDGWINHGLQVDLEQENLQNLIIESHVPEELTRQIWERAAFVEIDLSDGKDSLAQAEFKGRHPRRISFFFEQAVDGGVREALKSEDHCRFTFRKTEPHSETLTLVPPDGFNL